MSNFNDLRGPLGNPGPAPGPLGSPSINGRSPDGRGAPGPAQYHPGGNQPIPTELGQSEMPALLRKLIAQYGRKVGEKIFSQIIKEMELYGKSKGATSIPGGRGGMDFDMMSLLEQIQARREGRSTYMNHEGGASAGNPFNWMGGGQHRTTPMWDSNDYGMYNPPPKGQG